MRPLVLGPEEEDGDGDGGLRVGNVRDGRDGSGFNEDGNKWGEDEGDASGGESEG